jgi:hypothetical protein
MTPFNPVTSLLRCIPIVLVLLLFSAVQQSCIVDSDDGELASYQGSRPLTWKRITQSLTSDIQWVGGRVAVVGVNKGTAAALDSTLVYLQIAADNSISSPVTFGVHNAKDAVSQYGGTPLDSLQDETSYTVWIAERDVFDGGLNPSQYTEFNFADTTVTTQLFMRGRAGGGSVDGQPIATVSIVRDERLTGVKYFVTWPEGTAYRRAAIRAATTGGWTDLIWHIVTDDDLPDNIVSPFAIGDPIPGTSEVIPWPETGFELDTIYILWMANSDWTPNTFTPSAPGYTWFRLFAITE